MERRKRIGLAALAALVGLGGCTTPDPAAPAPGPPEQNLYHQTARLAAVMELLHENYADSSRATYERLLEGALRGMARELDPYSGYQPPREFSSSQLYFSGQRKGYGLTVAKDRDEPLTVLAVLPDSPAARAGVEPEDRILAIEGRPTEGLTLEECLELLTKLQAEDRNILVRRTGRAEPLALKLRRGEFVIHPVPGKAVKLLPGGIGYLKVELFNESTPLEFQAALKKLQQQGLRALVLDLRDNPGGLVQGAAALASHFLKEGEPVITAVGRQGDGDTLRTGRAEPELDELPLAILINERSASASEILAGALQDHGRARLVGTGSFGKGSIQRMLKLPEGGALKFTIARYRTPKGRLIDGAGLLPDVRVELPPGESLQLLRQLQVHPGEIEPKTEHPVRDRQLEAAVRLLERKLEEKQP